MRNPQGNTPASEPAWPEQAEFIAVLEEAMTNVGVSNRAALAQKSGRSQNMLKNWWHGSAKPSWDALEDIAEALSTPLWKLAVAAGLLDANALTVTTDETDDELPIAWHQAAAAYKQAHPSDRHDIATHMSWVADAAVNRARLRKLADHDRRTTA